MVSSAHRARKEREHCNALLCAPVHLHVLFGCVAHSLGVYTVKLSQEYSINFLPFMAVAHPATARQQLRPVSATCMQWILLQETRPEHRRCGWCAASFQSPFPSPEPGSNLVKDLPRAQTGQANLLLSPPCSLHSLARPESNPAPSLPLLLFRSAHVGVGARTHCPRAAQEPGDDSAV